ncbi:hypothetical protein BJ944DRAFT_175578 [Cunninghamella echinulata]|nr:hypothetical protein BJ944DRAFT_175578 [Cunninghamella echinulata]
MFHFHKNEIFESMEELPITVPPIFEGYLYWYSDTNKWKSKLFRFDGSSFICLSANKIKLPRNTPIEYVLDSTTADISSLVTSPLLATPIQLSSNNNNNNNVIMAKYYQLPLFSIKLIQVTSITLIKINNKPSTCFCVHMDTKQKYLFKAKNQKDMDQWLFVLMNAWKFILHQQKLISSIREEEEEKEEKDHIPSSTSSPLLIHRPQYQQTSLQLPPPPIPPPHQQKENNNDNNINNTEYEERYTTSILSPEKEKWIEDWRKSLHLGNFLSPSNSSSFSSQMDIHEKQNQQQAFDNVSLSHSQHELKHSSMTIQLSDHHCPIKKKRSDEVKNWLSNKSQEHKDYDVHFFQDATTDLANESSVNNSSHKEDTKPSPLLHYHHSIRGKNIKIMNQFEQQQQEEEQLINNNNNNININNNNNNNKKKLFSSSPSSTPPIASQSPLHTLSKSETPNDIYKQMDQIKLKRQNKKTKKRINDIMEHEKQNISSSSLGLTPKDYYPHRSTSPLVVAPAIPPIIFKPTATATYTLVGSTASLGSTTKNKNKLNSNFLDPKLSDVFFPSRSSSSNIKHLYHHPSMVTPSTSPPHPLPPTSSSSSLPIRYQ